jgi:hypothetical protein
VAVLKLFRRLAVWLFTSLFASRLRILDTAGWSDYVSSFKPFWQYGLFFYVVKETIGLKKPLQ